MSGINFRDLLAKPADKIKRPMPLPAGTYRGVIKAKSFDVSRNKGTPFVRLTLQPTMAEADIAPEDLLEADGVTPINIAAKTLRIDMYLTDDAQYRVVELANSLGIPTEGRSLGEIIEDFPNNNVIMSVTQSASTVNPEEIFNNVNKLAAAD